MISILKFVKFVGSCISTHSVRWKQLKIRCCNEDDGCTSITTPNCQLLPSNRMGRNTTSDKFHKFQSRYHIVSTLYEDERFRSSKNCVTHMSPLQSG